MPLSAQLRTNTFINFARSHCTGLNRLLLQEVSILFLFLSTGVVTGCTSCKKHTGTLPVIHLLVQCKGFGREKD